LVKQTRSTTVTDNIRDVTALGTLYGWQAAEKAGEPAAQHPEARVVIFPLRGSWFAVRA
jgi:hypothetical protein